MMTSGRGVAVIGSVNLDHVVRVRELPPPGATIAAWSYLTAPGGKGLNQAVTAARMGAPVTFVACLGSDAAGRALLDLLDAEGIDRHRVRTVGDEATGVALVTVADQGVNTVVVAAGANGRLAPADVDAGVTDGVAVVLTQLEIPLETVQRTLEAARAAGAVTILNPAPAAGPLTHSLLHLVDILVPNQTEASTLTGDPAMPPEAAAASLVRAGAGAVIVTLGERGAVLVRAGQVIELAPFSVQAIDSTAAGDAFCGALAAGLARGETLVDASRWGCAAGALAASRVGAAPSLPHLPDVERLLDQPPV